MAKRRKKRKVRAGGVLLALAFTHDGDAAQRRLGCFYEMISYSGYTLGKTSHHLLAIEGIIILHDHRGLTLMRTNEDTSFELRNVELHRLNVQWSFAYLIFVDNSHLIDEVYL